MISLTGPDRGDRPRDWLPPCRVGSCFPPSNPSGLEKVLLVSLALLFALLYALFLLHDKGHRTLVFEFEFELSHTFEFQV